MVLHVVWGIDFNFWQEDAMRNVLNVVVLVALCLVGISACNKNPFTPSDPKLVAVYVPASTSVVQGKSVDLEPLLDGKNVLPSSCSTPAGTAQVVTENGKHLVRVTGLVIGTDHKVTCSVPGANDGFAKVTVTEPPLVFDIEYSWDEPAVLVNPLPTAVGIHVGVFIFNGEPGAVTLCNTIWTPTPSTSNTWTCSGVSFERTRAYYIRVADGKRGDMCSPSCGNGFGERVRMRRVGQENWVLLTRVGPYFVDSRGLVRLDFDSNGIPR